MGKSKSNAKAAAAGTQNDSYVLQLYIAGDEPNSKKAQENLAAICARHLDGRYELEIVDVLEDFQKGLEKNILVTPTLVVVDPPRPTKIVGNLGDTDKVLSAMGLPRGE